MKTRVRLFAVAMLLVAGAAFGQANQSPVQGAPQNQSTAIWTEADHTGFCEKDTRLAVRTYCQDLAEYQTAVNKGTAGNLDLNKLDLTHPAAVVKFITAAEGSTALNNLAATAATSFSGLPNGIVQSPDQQSGSGATASGSTSLVSTAGSAALLSFALDAGALTESVNGTTATLNTNADQLFRAITRKNPDCIFNCGNISWLEEHILNPTNISANVSLAQQSSTTAGATGQASGTTPTSVSSVAIPSGVGRLSEITTRYQVRNKFNPRTSEFRGKWNDAVKSSQPLKDAIKSLGDATDTVMAIVKQKATPLDPTAAFAAAKSDPTGIALANLFADYFSSSSQASLQDSSLATDISKVMQDRAIYRDVWYAVLDNAVGNLFTVEYSFNRPLNQPETHDATLIYAYNFGTMGMITFNGSASIYAGAFPAGAKYGRLHYGQVSFEYDQTLNSKTSKIQAQLSLAGYWQYQPNPSILNIPAGTVAPGTTILLPNGTQEFVGTAGSLWVTQAKITFKGTGGISVPVGVSWSNKTDLLQGSKVGAQIGISYNLPGLTSLFGGGSNN